MSDIDPALLDDTQIDPNEPVGVRQLRDHAKQLQADLNAEKTKNAASEALLRENALLKAKVDLSTPVGQMFAKAYDGDLDVDKITEAAREVGALTDPAAPPPVVPSGPELTDAEKAQTGERNALAADAGTAATQPGEDPVQAGFADFRAELGAGRTRDDASVTVISRMIAAANDGDPRFRFDSDRWKAEAAQRGQS